VPTFRDAQTGLWARFDPETLASPRGFAADPGLVWRWYMGRFGRAREVRPNPGHLALARLEAHRGYRDFALYTQNVDDLHERAGSRAVHHLHGRITSFRCHECSAPHSLRAEDQTASQPPACRRCGGLVRPDVVWFGEMLPEGILERAWAAAGDCAVLLVAGTSGQVYPAADLPRLAQRAGARVIDVNPEPTGISSRADVFLRGPSGEVLPRVLRAMGIET
jgi:NAD-dependent deacetylase